MGRIVLVERAREHYESLGWTVTDAPELRVGPDVLRPELLATKGPRTKAVRIDEDPLGKFQIGMFAAACKRGSLQGVVICPIGDDVIAACEEMGVEYLSPEGLGRAIFLPKAGPPVAQESAAPVPTPAAVSAPEAAARATVPWWRWAIVAVVWSFALYFVWRLIDRIAG